MRTRMRTGFVLAAALGLSACTHARPSACTALPSDSARIGQVIRSLFDALARDDADMLARATSPSFYSYDGGRRLTADELATLVREARARGVQLNWNIGPIDTHIGCDSAWAAWENRGSAGVPPDVVPVVWLESAMLRRTGSAWQIDFFHSSRAAPAP